MNSTTYIPNSLPVGVLRFVNISTLQELWLKQLHDHLNENQLKNADLIFNKEFEPHIQTVCYHIILRTAEFTSHCGRTRIMLHNLSQGCLPYIKMFSRCHKKKETNEYTCKSLGGSDDYLSLCGEFPSQCFPTGSVTCMMGGNPPKKSKKKKEKEKENPLPEVREDSDGLNRHTEPTVKEYPLREVREDSDGLNRYTEPDVKEDIEIIPEIQKKSIKKKTPVTVTKKKTFKKSIPTI